MRMRSPARREVLRAAFHTAGMRMTRQRMAIFRELESRFDHPDVEHLYQAVKPRIPRISLFTIYRTMNALESAGMVRRVATWKGRARYDACISTHAHFLCEQCGTLSDVDLPAFGTLAQSLSGFPGHVDHLDLICYGRGHACCAKAASSVPPQP